MSHGLNDTTRSTYPPHPPTKLLQSRQCASRDAPHRVERMTARRPRHHAGTHLHTARKVCALAAANPDAVCWRDGLTLDQHPPHHDGKRPTWTGGHTIDGWVDPPPWVQVTRRPPPGPWIAPEASTCNYAAGAGRNETLRANPTSRRWFA